MNQRTNLQLPGPIKYTDLHPHTYRIDEYSAKKVSTEHVQRPFLES